MSYHFDPDSRAIRQLTFVYRLRGPHVEPHVKRVSQDTLIRELREARKTRESPNGRDFTPKIKHKFHPLFYQHGMK